MVLKDSILIYLEEISKLFDIENVVNRNNNHKDFSRWL